MCDETSRWLRRYVALEEGSWELLLGAVDSTDPRCRFVAAKKMEQAMMHEESVT